MKILTVTQAYPSQSLPSAMAFVHSRNLLYKNSGHEVAALSFDAEETYVHDGITVYSEDAVREWMLEKYDAVVFHAPNVRNHLRYFKRHKPSINRLILIVHMAEWIDRKDYWPEPYSFLGFWRRRVKPLLEQIYDFLKLWTWRNFLLRASRDKIKIIFVSNWIREQAEKSIGLKFEALGVDAKVIHNPIHPVFLDAKYDSECAKDADFVTIRPLDDSKYAVDVVCEMAHRYPTATFHVYGRGSFFEHFEAPRNLTFIEGDFPQAELPKVLNRYKAALLPTRLDSQGVLMCEIAAMGMPLVVSDLSICKEMVGEFGNVAFINNENPDLPVVPNPDVERAKLASKKFWADHTAEREIQVFQSWS